MWAFGGCGAHPTGVGNKRPNEKPSGTFPDVDEHRWMHGELEMSDDIDTYLTYTPYIIL